MESERRIKRVGASAEEAVICSRGDELRSLLPRERRRVRGTRDKPCPAGHSKDSNSAPSPVCKALSPLWGVLASPTLCLETGLRAVAAKSDL